MAKVVTFGEVMLRLSTPGYLRFSQAHQFDATFGGGEANVAVSLANYGVDAHFVTRMPQNDIADMCIAELKGFGVNTDGIVRIATPQTAPLRERQPDGSRHPFDSFICAKTPAGRWLDPDELAGPAVFLASHASDAVNGHILYVDGGILAYIGKQPK